MQNLVWLGACVTLSCDSPHFQIEYYMDSHLFICIFFAVVLMGVLSGVVTDETKYDCYILLWF